MLNLTPALRCYARYRSVQLTAMDPAATQAAQLISLVRRAQNTKFGRDHGFSSIRSVQDYQRQVPIRRYEQFWDQYWKATFPHFQGTTWHEKVPFIPVSSGTSSGTTKYIPCSPAMLRSNTKAGLDLLVHHLTNRPKSQIFGGKSFIIGGSTDLVEQAPGIWSGDLSGIAVKTLPWWARLRYFPPADLALLKDWEQKMRLLSEGSLTQQIRLLSGVPNWLLILFDKLFELLPQAEGRISKVYPELEMLVVGGVSFAPYAARFRELLQGSAAEIREVYPASECFIAIADRAHGEGLRMNLDHDLFFEFVPLEEIDSPHPTRHWIADIQPEVNYAIVLSTCAGLWSYLVGDTVRFTDTKTPRLLITGRTSYYLSAFGEHLIAEEIEQAVSSAAERIGEQISDFSVGAVYPERAGELGGHRFVVEFSSGTVDPTKQVAFLAAVDERLSKLNEDYQAHRAKDFGLRPPALLAARTGMFAAWMKFRGKLGGQNKVPRIITDQELFSRLCAFSENYR